MPKTVLALYRNPEHARAAFADLVNRRVRDRDISVITGASAAGALADMPLQRVEIPGFGTVGAWGPVLQLLSRGQDGITGALSRSGIPDPDNFAYVEGIRRGGTLVLTSVGDAIADEAAEILDSHDPEDPDELAASAHQPVNPEPVLAPVPDEDTIRIFEEDLEVGRRQVERGGVVVRRDVSNIPVERKIELTDEHVEIDRRPTDREPAAAEWNAFEPAELIFVDTAEEVVITKTPRVVEEILIKRTRRTREETVRDSVRRTEVRIEPR